MSQIQLLLWFNLTLFDYLVASVASRREYFTPTKILLFVHEMSQIGAYVACLSAVRILEGVNVYLDRTTSP
jgi:hypothetical protein